MRGQQDEIWMLDILAGILSWQDGNRGGFAVLIPSSCGWEKTEIIGLDHCACPALDLDASGFWCDGDDALSEEGTVLACGPGKMVLWEKSNDGYDEKDAGYYTDFGNLTPLSSTWILYIWTLGMLRI